jgi:rod shape determining protein RodA
MLAFLVTLITLFLAINKSKFELRPFYRFWIYHPFVVYLGCISVATIANFTALFVGIGWQGEPFAATTWSIFLIIIALLLICGVFVYFNRVRKQLVFLALTVFLASTFYILSLGFVFAKIMKPHQQQRILVTLNQDVDEYYAKKSKGFSIFKFEKSKEKDKSESKRDYSYNVRQSKISIGAGRWVGNGFNNGTQTKAKLVPEQHTDFIFCTVGEEYGFLGSTLFLIIYLLLIGRVYYLAERQKNVFSRVFGYSTASILFFHFFVNIGMALGILPVIGIPLPFMSYGGSSLISFSMLLFTFLKLDANRINEISRLN